MKKYVLISLIFVPIAITASQQQFHPRLGEKTLRDYQEEAKLRLQKEKDDARRRRQNSAEARETRMTSDGSDGLLWWLEDN